MTRFILCKELVLLSRLLYPRIRVHNPRKRLLERATRDQSKEIQEISYELTEAISKLNQCFRLRKGVTQIESSREDNLNALALLVEQLNPETLGQKGSLETYRAIRRHFPGTDFSQKEIRLKTGLKKTSTARHINTLLHYGLIEQTGGNQRGYTYRLKVSEETLEIRF
jgi:DNA-binding MarR family transcriptional regulator